MNINVVKRVPNPKSTSSRTRDRHMSQNSITDSSLMKIQQKFKKNSGRCKENSGKGKRERTYRSKKYFKHVVYGIPE